MLLKKLKWMADGLMSVNPNSDRIYNTSNNLSALTNIRSFTTIHLSAAKSMTSQADTKSSTILKIANLKIPKHPTDKSAPE